MSAANLNDIIDQIGVGLSTIAGLKVYPFPPKSAQTPFAFVDMPESWDYDLTFGRGEDRATFQVIVGVSATVDRASRAAVAEYAAGAGAKSVKAAVEAATIGNSVRVTSVDFGMIALASGVFQGATFQLDVTA